MKNLYRVSIIYTGERPVHNHLSRDKPFVENGDVLQGFFVTARTSADAYIEANNEWKKSGPEADFFTSFSDAIFIKCDAVQWENMA